MFEIGRDIFKHGFYSASVDRDGHKRMRWIYYIFVAVFVIFILRTLSLGIEGTDKARRGLADGEWQVQRADIVDRNGEILAKNIMSGHIILRPQMVKDRDAVAQAIHQIFPYKFSLAQALDLVNSSRKYISVKDYASDAERAAVEEADLAGLEIEARQRRRYPKRRLFSHIIGFVGKDGHGLEATKY